MRKGLLAGVVALTLALVACGGDARPTLDEAEGPLAGTATNATTADVPKDAADFLERATGGTGATFGATYHVLRKLGPVETDIEVAHDAPWSRIRAGDVVVISGPDDYTCLLSAAKCVAELREQQLTPFGVFSAFFSTGPVQAVETMSRVDGATFERSTRTAAGLELDCLAVLVRGAQSGEWCITPDGFFGYVDTADVRIELRDYQPALQPDFEPPGIVVDDDGFLVTTPGATPSEAALEADPKAGAAEAAETFDAAENPSTRCDDRRCGD